MFNLTTPAGVSPLTTTATLTNANFTFVPDLPVDNRSKSYILSALVGTQTGVQIHTVEAPKQLIFKRPASFRMPSGYNQVSGKYGVVPKNVSKVIFRGSAKVGANQWEGIPIELSIPIPAGSMSYDRANVEASVLAFITGLFDQREELLTALYDGNFA